MKLSIVPIPLLSHKGKILWGVEEDHNKSDLRRLVRNRKNAGPNVLPAFKNALESKGKILFIVDDRFTFEQKMGNEPNIAEATDFLLRSELPVSFLEVLQKQNAFDSIVAPPGEFFCSKYSFSEKKTNVLGNAFCRFSNECSTAFTLLMDFIEKNVDCKEIQVFIPPVCTDGVTSAVKTAYLRQISTKKIDIFVDLKKLPTIKGPF